MKTHTIIIMPDGETWNTIDGCTVMVIDSRQFTELCEDQVKARELTPVTSFSFNDS